MRIFKYLSTSLSSNGRMAWLDLLRAIAVLLVIWDHFSGALLGRLERSWLPDKLANELVFAPLGITQNGGFLGVAIFFLISGYIITVVIQRETSREFVVRRILRVFPLLAAAVTFVALQNPLVISEMSASEKFFVTVENATLLNYMIPEQVILVGVAWSLAVEVVFYILALALKPIFSRSLPLVIFPATLVAISALVIATARSFGAGYFQFSVQFLYMPIIVLGAIFALREAQEIRTWLALGVGFFAYVTFLFGTETYYPQFLSTSDSYPISFVFAVAIFGIIWLCRKAIPRLRIISIIALTSYSIYLVHGLVGLPLLGWLVITQHWSFTPAFVAAIVVTGLVSVMCFLLIETPFNKLARRVTRRRAAYRPTS